MAEILMKQSKFITTKHDRDLHGLGLTCVEEAIKHYDGICKFLYKMENFMLLFLFRLEICPIKHKNNPIVHLNGNFKIRMLLY